MADKVTPEDRDLIEKAMHKRKVIPQGVTTMAPVPDKLPPSMTVDRRIEAQRKDARNSLIVKRLKAGHLPQQIAKDYGLSVSHIKVLSKGRMKE